ncbi:unnamed protein product, partial [Brassica rapa subsp. narinosa]
MLTNRPRLDPIFMGEAKVHVEVRLDRPFPQRAALEDEDGSVFVVPTIGGSSHNFGTRFILCQFR